MSVQDAKDNRQYDATATMLHLALPNNVLYCVIKFSMLC